MDKKCSYCWQLCKVEKNLIFLECNHSICRKCLLFLELRNIKNCPICLENFFYKDIIEDSELSNKDRLSRMAILLYKSISESILMNLDSLRLLKKFDLTSIKLSKNSQTISSIISDLHEIKNSKTIETSNLNISVFKAVNSLINFKKYFLRILLSYLKFNQIDDPIWLGKKLVTLKIDNICKETFTIRNDGKSKITLCYLAFGIRLTYPEVFYLEKFTILHNGNAFNGFGKQMVREVNGIAFGANLIDFGLNPNETLEIVFETVPGVYIAIKNQLVHNYKDCDFVASSKSNYSFILGLKFK